MATQIYNAKQIASRAGVRPGYGCAASMLVAAISMAAAMSLTGCDARSQREIAALLSNAKGVVTNLEARDDAGVINDAPDYGIKISFQVQNVGEAGLITLRPWISSSEGEWQREQKIQFAAGETRPFDYFFHEPTINASNVQYGVSVSPGPGK